MGFARCGPGVTAVQALAVDAAAEPAAVIDAPEIMP